MTRTLAIVLAMALAAAIVPQGSAPAEAAKKKAKSSANSPAIFSELQGISSSVEPVETRSRPRKPGARCQPKGARH